MYECDHLIIKCVVLVSNFAHHTPYHGWILRGGRLLWSYMLHLAIMVCRGAIMHIIVTNAQLMEAREVSHTVSYIHYFTFSQQIMPTLFVKFCNS